MKTFVRERHYHWMDPYIKFHIIFEIHCAHCNVYLEVRTCVMVHVWGVSNEKRCCTCQNVKVENYVLSAGLSEDLSLGGRL